MARSSGLGVLIKSIYVIVVIVVVVVAIVCRFGNHHQDFKNNFDRKCFLVFGLFLDLSSKGVTQKSRKKEEIQMKIKQNKWFC